MTAKVEFVTDMDKFEAAVKATFGYFQITDPFKVNNFNKPSSA